MDEAEIIAQLRAEGFREVTRWHNGPDEMYPPHTHNTRTAHVVMQGSIFVTQNDKEVEFREGDRFDVPARVVHSARMGEMGCTYMIGEEYEEI